MVNFIATSKFVKDCNKLIDFAVYLKGITQGGIVNKTYTIPIFLFPRFEFNKIST